MSNQEISNRIYATLILRGKELDPQVVTDQLGIKPSKSFKRGDKRTEQKKWHHGFWGLTSDEVIQSTDLADHIEWLMNQIEPVRQNLLKIMNEKDINAEISCLLILSTDHDELYLKPEILYKISSLGLQLNLDIYGP
jgi:Domain of unknown function (DUF4279)